MTWIKYGGKHPLGVLDVMFLSCGWMGASLEGGLTPRVAPTERANGCLGGWIGLKIS